MTHEHDLSQSRSFVSTPAILPADRLLAAIVESSDDAIVSKDLNGVVTSWNKGAENLFGFSAAEAIGQPITIIIPKDRLNEEPVILERIRRGEYIADFETIRCHKDGHPIDISLTISPVRSTNGEIIGASKIARDITGRKRLEAQQTLLLREMAHRVKNVLAVINGLVAISARSAETPQDMAKILSARIDAYMRAHELIRPSLTTDAQQQSRPTNLRKLVAILTAPYAGEAVRGSKASVSYEGEDISIAGDTVTDLALVLHEFTTNAAKYGALSQDGGCVRISCRVDDGDYVLTWQESGGPPVDQPPTRIGFGTQLARRTVEGRFHGSLQYEWHASGLEIIFRIPMENLPLNSKPSA